MKNNDNVYKWNDIVIGGTPEAILYACINDCYLLFTRRKPLSEFDYLSHDYNLEPFGLENKIDNLKGFSCNFERTTKNIGIHKDIFLDKTLHLMSLCGKVPLSDNVSSIVYTERENLRIVTNRDRRIHVNFDNLYVFEESMLKNNPLNISNISIDHYCLMDILEFNQFVKCNYIEAKREFPEMIHIKDNKIYAESILTPEEFGDFDFSEFAIRLVCEEIMAEYRRNDNVKMIIKPIHSKRLVEKKLSFDWTNKANIFYKNDKFDSIFKSQYRFGVYYNKIKNLL